MERLIVRLFLENFPVFSTKNTNFPSFFVLLLLLFPELDCQYSHDSLSNKILDTSRKRFFYYFVDNWQLESLTGGAQGSFYVRSC